ncbi:cyclic nucleotide-binding domain-containing protein [Oleiharenicola lentus]|jgi:CRP-like cAMP-binding protein|uniref:Cyclic nucleotide-binding domain-containing protein n=1 Tax=Oleiharenicola lentus TaxID=2508720 RepID=A0A4Q1C918_9BACT|nr:cyclic nucleotide-binding domain-containing protein [Oleiharenicola lentus]RXK55366.1 cyclic nucleotide-binding domain-containing protein [Oleiharenicola lentus]
MSDPTDNFIRRLPVMAGLDDEAVQFLQGLASEETHAAGSVIVREGAPGDRMYFVRSGRVRVMKAPAVQLAEFGPGDFFGEMSLVESVARSASVIALEPTRVCTLRGVDFYKLYRQRPEQYGIVMLNIARDLARRLRHIDDDFCHVKH